MLDSVCNYLTFSRFKAHFRIDSWPSEIWEGTIQSHEITGDSPWFTEILITSMLLFAPHMGVTMWLFRRLQADLLGASLPAWSSELIHMIHLKQFVNGHRLFVLRICPKKITLDIYAYQLTTVGLLGYRLLWSYTYHCMLSKFFCSRVQWISAQLTPFLIILFRWSVAGCFRYLAWQSSVSHCTRTLFWMKSERWWSCKG